MGKVRFVSKCLKWVFAACIILFPVLQVVLWSHADRPIFFHFGSTFLPSGVDLVSLEASAAKTKFLCFSISMVPTGIVMGVCFLLVRLLSLYAKGIIFEPVNVSLIKKIAYLLLVKAVIGPIYEGALTAVWTMSKPVGQRMFYLSTQTVNLTGIIIVLMILVVAWVMAEGQKLQQEQQLTI